MTNEVEVINSEILAEIETLRRTRAAGKGHHRMRGDQLQTR